MINTSKWALLRTQEMNDTLHKTITNKRENTVNTHMAASIHNMSGNVLLILNDTFLLLKIMHFTLFGVKGFYIFYK